MGAGCRAASGTVCGVVWVPVIDGYAIYNIGHRPRISSAISELKIC